VDLGNERPQVPGAGAQSVADRAARLDRRPRAGRRRRHHDLPRLDHHRRGAAGERIGGGMQSEVASEITIQVRPSPGRDIDRDAVAVAVAMRAQPGIVEVRPFTKEESAKAAGAMAR